MRRERHSLSNRAISFSTSCARFTLRPAELSSKYCATFVERALASSRQESIAGQQQVEILGKANAQLRELAVQRERKVVKVRHFAYHDELTGLPNPNLLLDRLNQALVRAKRQRKQLALPLLDLDDFKAINDRLGHGAGDRLLQRAAERLHPRIRGADKACRYGEDEFVPRLPEVDDEKRALDESPKACARLAKRDVVDDYSSAVMVSVGVARYGVARSAPQCSTWKLTDFCLSAGIDWDATPHVERLLTRRSRFRKGDALYRVGDGFNTLYAIRSGSCKTVLRAKDGQGQVAGYHMAGEIIGMDGIGTDIHECQAIALEDMEVCPLPFDQIENVARLSEQFRHNLQRLLSQESARARTLMIVLGTMRAEQRLAMFLLDLSQRYRARGYSSCEFVLRLTREEIGSHLGLKLETVSRLSSRFQREGLIQVEGRTVRLLDRVAVSQPRWNLEGRVFVVALPAHGICPIEYPTAVRRFYNQRALQNDANHRYVTSATIAQQMPYLGWIDEGVVMCGAP